MKINGWNRALHALSALLVTGGLAYGATTSQKEGRITVAVAVTDIEPIVKAVGGGRVDTVTVF